MKKALLLILLVTFPFLVKADGLTEPLSILEVGTTKSAGGYVFVNVSPAESVSGCKTTTQIRFESDDNMAELWLSILLAAKVSGGKVKFYLQSNNCLGDGPRPTTITFAQ